MENLTPEEIDQKFVDYTTGRYKYREDKDFYDKPHYAENCILPVLELGEALGYDKITQLKMIAIYLQDKVNEYANMLIEERSQKATSIIIPKESLMPTDKKQSNKEWDHGSSNIFRNSNNFNTFVLDKQSKCFVW